MTWMWDTRPMEGGCWCNGILLFILHEGSFEWLFKGITHGAYLLTLRSNRMLGHSRVESLAPGGNVTRGFFRVVVHQSSLRSGSLKIGARVSEDRPTTRLPMK